MITVHGIEYTKREVEASIETLSKQIKVKRELVLESVEVSEVHAKNLKSIENRIKELKTLLESEL